MINLIDKAEALAAILKTPGRFAGCTEAQVRKMVAEWIAALPARGVGVRPLTWEPHWTGGEEAREFAQVPIGMDYHVNDEGWWQTHSPLYRCANRKAAKAAAQADYEARIRAALAPTDAAQAREDVDIVEWLRAGPDDVSISFTLQGPNGMLSVQYEKPRVAAELVEEWRRSK